MPSSKAPAEPSAAPRAFLSRGACSEGNAKPEPPLCSSPARLSTRAAAVYHREPHHSRAGAARLPPSAGA